MTANDPFYQAIAPVRDAVEALVGLIDPDTTQLPDADSPAMKELALEHDYVGEWGHEPVHHAHVLGSFKRLLAVDCATAMLRDLHDDPPPVYAHKVLSRAVIENVASAAWILEPGVPIKQRIARGRNERIYSAQQILSMPDLPEELRKQRQATIDSIRQTASELEFSVTANGWIEEDRPRFTKLLKWLLTDDLGATVANYFSAVAHGTQYGLSSSVLSTDPPTALGQRRVAIGTAPHNVRFAVSASGMALVKGVSFEFELFGRDVPRWQEACARVLEEVGTAMQQSKVELVKTMTRDQAEADAAGFFDAGLEDPS